MKANPCAIVVGLLLIALGVLGTVYLHHYWDDYGCDHLNYMCSTPPMKLVEKCQKLTFLASLPILSVFLGLGFVVVGLKEDGGVENGQEEVQV